MDVFEKVCWLWVKNISIFNTINDFSDSKKPKFEYIFEKSNNYPDLKILPNFFDSTEISDRNIKMNIKRGNQTKSLTFDHWTNWNEEMTLKFEKTAGSHMRNLGYDL